MAARAGAWSTGQRALIGRAGYYIHLAVSPAQRGRGARRRTARSSSRSTAARRSAASTGAATTTTSGGIPKDADRFAITHDAGITLTTAARPQHAARARCRSARCITSPSTTRCRTTSTATCRTTARCAGSTIARGGRRRRLQRLGQPVGPRPRRLRVGLHRSRSRRSEHRLVDVLRQQGDALRPPHEDRALGGAVACITLDAPPTRVEVPLPLDGAAGDRSVRSQQRLLRLQRDLPHHQRRPELAA